MDDVQRRSHTKIISQIFAKNRFPILASLPHYRPDSGTTHPAAFCLPRFNPLHLDFMLAHPERVARALRGNFLRQVRIVLGLKPRPKAPVLTMDVPAVVERHSWICRTLQENWPPDLDLTNRAVCEVGAGDCLAAASLMLGRGARHVMVVEKEPPVVNAKQREVLATLNQRGFPCDQGLLTATEPPQLDPQKLTYHTEYMEDYRAAAEHAFLYSFCVGEHVEDLAGFFRSCHRALEPGGVMWHYVDLGGHGFFEDPMPPLEFQRYSNALYGWMYPRYHRATRRFVRDYAAAAKAEGFTEIKTTPIRTADPAYVAELQPDLRTEARALPTEELGVIEFVLQARKPQA
jgi:hypothetical protein